MNHCLLYECVSHRKALADSIAHLLGVGGHGTAHCSLWFTRVCTCVLWFLTLFTNCNWIGAFAKPAALALQMQSQFEQQLLGPELVSSPDAAHPLLPTGNFPKWTIPPLGVRYHPKSGIRSMIYESRCRCKAWMDSNKTPRWGVGAPFHDHSLCESERLLWLTKGVWTSQKGILCQPSIFENHRICYSKIIFYWSLWFLKLYRELSLAQVYK